MNLDNISLKINALPSEKRKEFFGELIQNLYDEGWCELNNIDYVNPDFRKAKQILFREKYTQYISAKIPSRLPLQQHADSQE